PAPAPPRRGHKHRGGAYLPPAGAGTGTLGVLHTPPPPSAANSPPPTPAGTSRAGNTRRPANLPPRQSPELLGRPAPQPRPGPGPPRRPRLARPRAGHRRRHLTVEHRGDDVVLAQFRVPDDLGDRARRRGLHRLGDLTGAHVQSAAEDAGEAQH